MKLFRYGKIIINLNEIASIANDNADNKTLIILYKSGKSQEFIFINPDNFLNAVELAIKEDKI